MAGLKASANLGGSGTSGVGSLNSLTGALTLSSSTLTITPSGTNIDLEYAGGGVSSFTGDSALLSNSASTGAVTATLANAAAYSVWGNTSGISAAPAYTTNPIVGSLQVKGSTNPVNGIGLPTSNIPAIYANSTKIMQFNNGGSAVNFANITAQATGSPLLIGVSGDANAGIEIQTQGSGAITLATGAGTGKINFGASGNSYYSEASNYFLTNQPALGVTQNLTSGYYLQNTTAAATAMQQISPPITWEGQGWATTPLASQSVKFQAYVLPVQSSSTPTGVWVLQASLNGAAFVTTAQITSSGLIQAINGIASYNSTNANFYCFSGTTGNRSLVAQLYSTVRAVRPPARCFMVLVPA